MKEREEDHVEGDSRDGNPKILLPGEIGSFVSRMKRHGFRIDYLGENRFRIGDGPHENSLLIIQIDAPEFTIVDVTEEFISHYCATSRKATLKQLIVEALQESGILPRQEATDKTMGNDI